MIIKAPPRRNLFYLLVLGLLFNIFLQFDTTERLFNSLWDKQVVSSIGYHDICKKPEISCARTSQNQLKAFFFAATGTASSHSPSIHAIRSEHPNLFVPGFLAPPAHLFSRLVQLNLYETHSGRSPPIAS
jgi:hypothetical protein